MRARRPRWRARGHPSVPQRNRILAAARATFRGVGSPARVGDRRHRGCEPAITDGAPAIADFSRNSRNPAGTYRFPWIPAGFSRNLWTSVENLAFLWDSLDPRGDAGFSAEINGRASFPRQHVLARNVGSPTRVGEESWLASMCWREKSARPWNSTETLPSPRDSMKSYRNA